MVRTLATIGLILLGFIPTASSAPDTFLHDVTQLSVGHGHVCAVTTNHDVVCWGDNAVGQLGIGKAGKAVGGELVRPHVVGGLPNIASVAAGVMHTCALDVDGDVYCWGSAGGDLVETSGGASGSVELKGDGLGTPVKMPLGAGKARLVALASIGNDACAVFADDVRCWNTFRAIAIGATTASMRQLRTVKLAGVTALAIGHGKACATTKQGLSCWNLDGTPTPAVWAKSDKIVPVDVSIGEMYACVVSATGEARCWWSLIDDFWKKPPNRTVRWSKKPATRAIAVGDSPICTADVRGTVDCFLSDEGGLTDDAIAASWATTKLAPHPITGIDDAIDLGIARGRDVFGYGFGCALRGSANASGAQVFCWGDNESGQLGTGDHQATKTAVPVLEDLP